MPRHVQAVLFDAVGTLLKPRPSVAEAYQAAGARHDVHLPLAEVQSRFDTALRECLVEDQQHHDHRTSETRERARWQAIVEFVFATPTNEPETLKRIFDDLWQHFADPENWALYDDVARTWQELERQEIHLGIASNFDERLLTIAEHHSPLADCQHWFVSSQVGHRKPGPRFFAVIERELSLESDQLLLVGDDLENDYRAARAAGWHAYHVDRTGAQEHFDGDPAHRLGRLDELIEVLAR